MSTIQEGDRVVVNKNLKGYPARDKGTEAVVRCIEGKQACVYLDGKFHGSLDVLALEHLDPAPPPRPEHPVLALFDEAVVVSRGSLSRHALSDIRAALAKRIEANPVRDVERYGCHIVELGPRQRFLVAGGKALVEFISGYEWRSVSETIRAGYISYEEDAEDAALSALANPPKEAT